MSTKEELAQFVENLSVISTHEHHYPDEFHAELTLEGIFANSYISWCGVPIGSTDDEHTRFIEQVRHNTYFIWLEKSLQKLYGFDGPITAGNWGDISKKIAAMHHADPDRHMKILRRHCRYVADVQDSYYDPGSDLGHPDIFRPAYRINMFLYGYHPDVVDHNGNNPLVIYDERPESFDAYLEFVEERVRAAHVSGCVALKSALAYDRSVAIGEPTRNEAARSWGRHPDELAEKEKTAFGDYVFNHIMEVALKLEMPVQVHLGLALLEGSNPLKFIPILDRNRNISFDLFHGGYPWTSIAAGIAQTYTTVWLDLCWLPLISTTAAVRALSEWLDVIGSCERILWGADTWTSEESFGALLAARAVVVEALTERIRMGLLDLDGARDLARKILFDNAKKLFGL